MIDHAVVITARPGEEAAVSAVLAGLAEQVRDLPGLLEVTHGQNVHGRSRERGVTHGLLIRLADEEALAAYSAHPAHTALIRALGTTCLDRVVLDWHTPSIVEVG